MPPVSCVFFDAAGTLIRLREPVGESYARIAAQHGIRVEPQSVETAFRQAWKATPPLLHPEDQPPADDDASWWRALVSQTFATVTGAPLPDETLSPLFEELYAHFAQPGVWELYEDTLPALDQLRDSHRLFVLSNFDRRLFTILEDLDIASRFERILVSSEVGASKPHPRIFHQALAAAGVPASECLHLGDDRKCDLKGAQQAGMHSRLVDRPGTTLLTLVTELGANTKPTRDDEKENAKK
ncbi:HAD-IA family hydrolase [Verrucomicrobium sp. BvORR106]|uniref:HAD-IA family hydrolase n=1 Tax=Verrucomicrobium sp. BvORR106 TaxID=1403819 RepID=UPI0006919965|nr:HAD-IA family hydrolase [Verrucomicrobium sp. BvORR106]